MSNLFFGDEGPQPPKVLTAPLEIYANLRPLLDNNIPLTLRFHERSQRYQSYLVEMNRETGWIALDELIPNDGERLLLQGEAFNVEGFYEGARIFWTSQQDVHLGEIDGARCYWIPTPAELTYHQRRNAYRAQLKELAVTAQLGGAAVRNALEGRLLDISATGCKLSIKGNQGNLQTGQVYELAAKLPIGTIQTEVELRHLVVDEKLDMTMCGLRFHRLSGLTQRQIERLVYQLQRDARRDNTDSPFG
ncbi:flagellar brake protein [Stutzerimonas stutzeri]|uniref:flagellar brake protein n=1 Tax=Stutzerimonas stutzeri TaxID=316 RepID=UPI000F76E29B|nr:flagellar brake protein [Stutzerimonas stutzeri]MCP3433503.1 flagellar brake protein [Stutzerimonas stutzeri]MDH0426455.1 flagellar brake protein [Stutzerimonas stutzeri]RRV57538.1 pilus assembly protein PilZ [Stutzerimonas stutzeri]RTM16031.1 pilus assembly protein PilZ [Stutzerimonas stutzeri]